MANQSTFGSTARKALVWAIAAVVAIFFFSFLVGMVIGLVKMAMIIAMVLFIGYAVIWAVRKL